LELAAAPSSLSKKHPKKKAIGKHHDPTAAPSLSWKRMYTVLGLAQRVVMDRNAALHGERERKNLSQGRLLQRTVNGLQTGQVKGQRVNQKVLHLKSLLLQEFQEKKLKNR
jgi:hypothetical protein